MDSEVSFYAAAYFYEGPAVLLLRNRRKIDHMQTLHLPLLLILLPLIQSLRLQYQIVLPNRLVYIHNMQDSISHWIYHPLAVLTAAELTEERPPRICYDLTVTVVGDPNDVFAFEPHP